jgi:hypothetical protein
MEHDQYYRRAINGTYVPFNGDMDFAKMKRLPLYVKSADGYKLLDLKALYNI